MFRLNRKDLGCPCDLCVHNIASRGMLGSPLNSIRTCRFCKEDISFFNGIECIKLNRIEKPDKSTFVTNTDCWHFELEIDILEKVVYNRLGFALSCGTAGYINKDGELDTAYDPLWVVMNSVNVMIKTNKAGKSSLGWLPQRLQNLYQSYRKEPDEQKCIIAAAIWHGIELNRTLSKYDSKTLERIKYTGIPTKHFLYESAILLLLGHPLFTTTSIRSKDDTTQKQLNEVVERVNEKQKQLIEDWNLKPGFLNN